MRDVFWNGFIDELEKIGGPSWLTDPLAVTARRAVAGHRGEGGIVTPGGSTSRSGLPAAKGVDISVGDRGSVAYAPTATGRAEPHQLPPFMSRSRKATESPAANVLARAAESFKQREAKANGR